MAQAGNEQESHFLQQMLLPLPAVLAGAFAQQSHQRQEITPSFLCQWSPARP